MFNSFSFRFLLISCRRCGTLILQNTKYPTSDMKELKRSPLDRESSTAYFLKSLSNNSTQRCCVNQIKPSNYYSQTTTGQNTVKFRLVKNNNSRCFRPSKASNNPMFRQFLDYPFHIRNNAICHATPLKRNASSARARKKSDRSSDVAVRDKFNLPLISLHNGTNT